MAGKGTIGIVVFVIPHGGGSGGFLQNGENEDARERIARGQGAE